jgi:hypothetical protein
MQEIKVLQQKKFKVTPFQSVFIGESELSDEEQEFSCKYENLPADNRDAGIVLSKNKNFYSEDGTIKSFVSYDLLFYTAEKNENGREIIEAEMQNLYFPDQLLENRSLITEDKSYEIIVDGKKCVIMLKEAGYYGFVNHYENDNALAFTISFYEDETTFIALENLLPFFFSGIKEVTENIQLPKAV